VTDRPYPARITQALDAPGWGGPPLEGPEVDRACGVEEPAVDLWEAGELVPTADQLARLAELTGYPVAWFYREPAELDPAGMWVCIRSGRGKGCYRGDDPRLDRALRPRPDRLALPVDAASAPAPAAVLEPPRDRAPECSGCERPMRRDVWRRQRGRCSRCGPP
jgi:transcriptional regulator with XRE-family HTH domain